MLYVTAVPYGTCEWPCDANVTNASAGGDATATDNE
jgi:hypothetical protein